MIGFTCCVNYSDFLAITYPLNKRFFSEFAAVTSSEDIATQSYCKDNGITLIISDSYKQGTFNRSAMLNKAIEHYANSNEWLVSMDSDVVMDVVDNVVLKDHVGLADWCSEDTLQEVLLGTQLDKDLIYGCPRKMIKDPCAVNVGTLRKNGYWFRYPYNLCAYLGYFQMFYKKSARNNEQCLNVNDSDTYFLNDNFGIDKARTFRNLVCYHLGEDGVNWNGRVSKEWK